MLKNPRFEIIKQFYSKSLNNYRDIIVYLPKDYNKENKYNAIYFHDGMEVFYPEWSLSGHSWDAANTIDKLVEDNVIPPTILIGICNNYDRLNEYSHFDFEQEKENLTIKAKAQSYEGFIIEELKPFLESRFSINPHRENNALIGSSMGGLVTFNMAFRDSSVFSKIGVMSPSFWVGFNATLEELKNTYKKVPLRVWIDYGSMESFQLEGYDIDLMKEPPKDIAKELLNKGYIYRKDFILLEDHSGHHSEKYWAQRLPSVIKYLFNGEIDIENHVEVVDIEAE